jgi:hypothetical protein
MVSTRSQTNKSSPKVADSTKKRKTATSPTPPPKKPKQTKLSTKGKVTAPKKESPKKENHEETIIINRAPVLHLWAASVAHATNPSLSWSTCLSAGNAVSAICAVSKGRSIGVMEPKEEGEKKKTKKDLSDGFEEIDVMKFHLRVKDEKAYMGSKAEPPGEENLKKKFGEQYDDAKKAFEDALKGWKGKEDQLQQKGFQMYEDFRPNVKPGTSGWGRKGELNLEHVQQVISGT